jgi:hypothetical protein
MSAAQGNYDAEMRKKCNDLEKRGIASPYWSEILEIIKWLETIEEYETCQDLWEYYENMTGKPD